jgi:queuine tRNA-ribosyltransferase
MVKDIFHGVACGIDTFDCVHPTRLARHGGALIQGHKGHLNLRNSSFKSDTKPIAENCDCYTCLTHHRGYLHHMLKAGELLAVTLISIHNIAFMNRLMYAIREAIRNGRLEDVRNEWVGS